MRNTPKRNSYGRAAEITLLSGVLLLGAVGAKKAYKAPPEPPKPAPSAPSTPSGTPPPELMLGCQGEIPLEALRDSMREDINDATENDYPKPELISGMIGLTKAEFLACAEIGYSVRRGPDGFSLDCNDGTTCTISILGGTTLNSSPLKGEGSSGIHAWCDDYNPDEGILTATRETGFSVQTETYRTHAGEDDPQILRYETIILESTDILEEDEDGKNGIFDWGTFAPTFPIETADEFLEEINLRPEMLDPSIESETDPFDDYNDFIEMADSLLDGEVSELIAQQQEEHVQDMPNQPFKFTPLEELLEQREEQ
jgi:hypothetical protein